MTPLDQLRQRIARSRELQFAEEGGVEQGGNHYVTIGGHANEKGEKHEGGTHVLLDGEGTIVKGPAHMVGHKPNAIPSRRKTPKASRVKAAGESPDQHHERLKRNIVSTVNKHASDTTVGMRFDEAYKKLSAAHPEITPEKFKNAVREVTRLQGGAGDLRIGGWSQIPEEIPDHRLTIPSDSKDSYGNPSEQYYYLQPHDNPETNGPNAIHGSLEGPPSPEQAVPQIDPHYQLPAKAEQPAPSDPAAAHESLAARHHAVSDEMEKQAETHPEGEKVKKAAKNVRAKGDEHKAKAANPVPPVAGEDDNIWDDAPAANSSPGIIDEDEFKRGLQTPEFKAKMKAAQEADARDAAESGDTDSGKPSAAEELQSFYGSAENGARSKLIDDGKIRAYVRMSNRPIGGTNRKMLDIADVEAKDRGKGEFTKFISDAEAKNPWGGVYVESVVNPRLAKFLEKRGYTSDNTEPPSYYKVAPTAKQQSSSPQLTPESLASEFNQLHANAGGQSLPVHQLRKHIAGKYGEEAASPEKLDPMLKSMRGKHIRFVGGTHGNTTPEENAGAIRGPSHDDNVPGPLYTHLEPHRTPEQQMAGRPQPTALPTPKASSPPVAPAPSSPPAATPAPAPQPKKPGFLRRAASAVGRGLLGGAKAAGEVALNQNVVNSLTDLLGGGKFSADEDRPRMTMTDLRRRIRENAK